jgi:hypothetical protein
MAQETKEALVSVSFSDETIEKLRALEVLHDTSVAAEIRTAVDRYLAANGYPRL